MVINEINTESGMEFLICGNQALYKFLVSLSLFRDEGIAKMVLTIPLLCFVFLTFYEIR